MRRLIRAPHVAGPRQRKRRHVDSVPVQRARDPRLPQLYEEVGVAARRGRGGAGWGGVGGAGWGGAGHGGAGWVLWIV